MSSPAMAAKKTAKMDADAPTSGKNMMTAVKIINPKSVRRPFIISIKFLIKTEPGDEAL
jgi:hypothetical protein